MVNHKSKKSIENQNYENYWKLTVEYTNINGAQFLNTLRAIVHFIDNNKELQEKYESRLYKELQESINEMYPKADHGSTRKSINQMIKLGLVYPYLSGYHEKTKEFLNAGNSSKRKLIFSEIFYKNAMFQSSVTRDKSHIKNIDFFLKTLMYKNPRFLNNEEIIALLSSDITLYRNGYMTQEELNQQIKLNDITKFKTRKYNQIAYLFNFLEYVPGIVVSKDKSKVFYEEDSVQYSEDIFDTTRDPILFRIMKERVYAESEEVYGKRVCYFTKKEQKALVVSHIVGSAEALRKGDVDTAYDPNNALLLEPNVDAYFDKHDLTFIADGSPIYGNQVSEDFKNETQNYRLDSKIMESRAEYMVNHNKNYDIKNN